jgi:uncharacterized BrkB/YihY/UPF0761 family membrane protein
LIGASGAFVELKDALNRIWRVERKSGGFLLHAIRQRFLSFSLVLVWIGAVIASLLFTTGKVLIGLYPSRSATTSAYGAVSSPLVVLVWIYYSAQILLFGAEITHVYANKHGSLLKRRPA